MLSGLLPTSATYWLAAGLTAALDLALVLLLVLRIPTQQFERSGRMVAAVGALFWSLLYGSAANIFWENCYRFALPAAARPLAPFFGLLLGILGYGFWWLSRRAGRHVVLAFLALGALHSLPGHLWAIYRQDLLSRCPLLIQVDPAPALVFGIFEFIFYWGLVLGVSALLSRK